MYPVPPGLELNTLSRKSLRVYTAMATKKNYVPPLSLQYATCICEQKIEPMSKAVILFEERLAGTNHRLGVRVAVGLLIDQ